MTRKLSFRYGLTVCAGTALLSLLLAAPAFPQTFEQRVDRYIHSLPADQEFQGVIFAAAGGRVYLNKGYGLASREFDIPNGPDTRFQIGSITKCFTAALVLKMVELGRLELDGAISDYLAYFPADPGIRITVRHLLTHTSGIKNHYQAVPDYWFKDDKVFHAPRELVSLFASLPRAHEPGADFTYSSPGYYILGAILERVGGKSFAELLGEYFFGPLGMKATRVENNREVIGMTATGYGRGIRGLIRAPFEDKSTALGAGDITTTAYDLYLWDQGLRAGKVLSPESLAILYKPVMPDSIFTPGGLVMSAPYNEGKKTVRINRLSGSSAGYASAMDRTFDPDACIIVLSNVNEAESVAILDNIGDFLTRYDLGAAIGTPGPETLTPPPGTEVRASDAERILGFYRTAKGSLSGVVRGRDGVYLLDLYSGGMSSALRLLAESDGTFSTGWPAVFKCRFAPDEKDGGLVLTRSRGERVLSSWKKIDAGKVEASAFVGSYSSVELQKTFRFLESGGGLVAERFLGGPDVRLIALDKDLWGCELGFLRFSRYADGSISGFTFIAPGLDALIGSKFVKI